MEYWRWAAIVITIAIGFAVNILVRFILRSVLRTITHADKKDHELIQIIKRGSQARRQCSWGRHLASHVASY